MKTRIQYVDVAKGILILLLVYGHINVISGNSGFDNPVLPYVTASMMLYSCFFMQSFFVITGLCSSFSMELGSFVLKNIKTLIIPAILLTLLNDYGVLLLEGNSINLDPVINVSRWFVSEKSGPWFIFALFWSKIIFWFINKCLLGIQILIVGLLFFIGVWNVESEIPEIQWYQHTLVLLPFIWGGHLLKGKIETYEKTIKWVAIVAIPVLVVERFLEWRIHFPMPIVDFNIGVDMISWPIHFVNVFLGTSLTFYISKKIQKNNFFTHMGKGSLLIYLVNVFVILLSLKLLTPCFNASSLLISMLYYAMTFTFSVIIFYLLIKIIYEHKEFSWLVGKW